jgi:hypothetical protein
VSSCATRRRWSDPVLVFSATVVLPNTVILTLRDYGFQFIAATFTLASIIAASSHEIVRGG